MTFVWITAVAFAWLAGKYGWVGKGWIWFAGRTWNG